MQFRYNFSIEIALSGCIIFIESFSLTISRVSGQAFDQKLCADIVQIVHFNVHIKSLAHVVCKH